MMRMHLSTHQCTKRAIGGQKRITCVVNKCDEPNLEMKGNKYYNMWDILGCDIYIMSKQSILLSVDN